MKITINILGRFHFFDLAKQLNKIGVLHQLITSYPTFKAKEWNIESKQIKSLVFIEIFRRFLSKTKFYTSDNIVKIKKVYGFLSSKFMNRDMDIFIFFAGNGFNLKIIKELKTKGKICIADEGSAHILEQIDILKKEYEKLGLPYKTKQNEELLLETIKEYQMSDYVVVPSSFVKRTFITQGIDENKIFVNPYGVDLSEFKQIEKKDNIFRVIFCGLLSIQKGSHYLLEAIYNLDLPNLELWHIGGVNEEMKPYIEKYKSDKIIYKGSFAQNELYKFYSQGSLFCIPSLQEGMAMVQLQAMACGLPLVCTTNTGGDDLIKEDGEEGFVIPIKSIEAIQEKITYLYNNQDECKIMGQKAKKRVSSGFTWDDYGNRYSEFLQEVYNAKKNN